MRTQARGNTRCQSCDRLFAKEPDRPTVTVRTPIATGGRVGSYLPRHQGTTADLRWHADCKRDADVAYAAEQMANRSVTVYGSVLLGAIARGSLDPAEGLQRLVDSEVRERFVESARRYLDRVLPSV